MPQARLSAQMAAPWWGLGWRERVLGAALVPIFGPQNGLNVPPEILPDYVCHQLGVDSADRAGVRQTLRRIYAAGLIVQDGDVLRLLYTPSSHKRYAKKQGSLRGPFGVPDAPDETQASGITKLKESIKGPERTPSVSANDGRKSYREALKDGIRDECRAQGISPAPHLAPWEQDGGADRVRELVESGRCSDAYSAARALTQAALRWADGGAFGPALLQARLPSLGVINIQPRDQIV